MEPNNTTKGYTLRELIWDAFLEAQYQDEHWKDQDTCDLIVKKITGESPVKYIPSKVVDPHAKNNVGIPLPIKFPEDI